MRNRYRSAGLPRETTEKELILCNLAVRREVFLAAGGFDERLYPNEENELLDRISASDHKLMHLPSMAVRRSQRATISAFDRLMFSYGRGRAQQTLIAGLRSPMSFMPLAFVIYLVLVCLLPTALFWKLPLIAYIALDLIFSVHAVITSRRPYAIILLFLFPLMHCANGTGLLYGFLGGKSRSGSGDEIVIRRVKEFGQSTW
jgi:hypothetical protein